MIGVAGFLIFRNPEEHESGIFPSSIQTIQFPEKTNIRAELLGAIFALETIRSEIEEIQKKLSQKEKFEITLYTDCQTISHLLDRRKKLEANNFTSQRKKESLSNADLYRKFLILFDKLQPKIYWVKGHSPQKNKSLIEKNFSLVDKMVREKIRKLNQI